MSDHVVKATQRGCENTEMSSWYLARLLDVYEEERRRGKTIDSTEVSFRIGSKLVALRDTPGHDNFVRNVVSALHKVDCVCLNVSMIEKEFVAAVANLSEKLELIVANGIKNVVVVANKMGSIEWCKETYKKT